MFEVLVETYAESGPTNLAASRVDDAALAAEQVRLAGAEVRLLHVIFVPEDETSPSAI